LTKDGNMIGISLPLVKTLLNFLSLVLRIKKGFEEI
jgi:hypothetical protein